MKSATTVDYHVKIIVVWISSTADDYFAIIQKGTNTFIAVNNNYDGNLRP